MAFAIGAMLAAQPVLLGAAAAVLVPLLFALFLAGRNAGGGAADWTRQLPSPRALPVLGHLLFLGGLPHQTLRDLAAAHGPVMLLRLGPKPVVVVSSAAGAQEAMKTRDLAFASRPLVRRAKRLLGEGDIAFSPYGDYWRRARRVCVVHLLSPHRVLSLGRVRRGEVASMVARVRAAAAAAAAAAAGETAAAAFDVGELLMAYSSNVVARASFGDGEQWFKDGSELERVFGDFEEVLGAPASVGESFPWLSWVDKLTGAERRLARTAEALKRIVERVIEGRRRHRQVAGRCEDDERKAFVDVLLDVNETDEAGIKLDNAEIHAILLDMFAAGTNTSYNGMAWTMSELMNNPHILKKLQQEIRTIVGDATDITDEQIRRMDYLKLVIKESLRLHPPIPTLAPRETLEDTELLGHKIPAKTRVMINAWAIARDRENWERPEEFLPERFAGVAIDYKGQDFQFIPFGAGRRGCPGIGFAAASMELALASLMYHFDWELPGGRKLDLTEEGGISVRAKSPLHLIAKPYSAVASFDSTCRLEKM
ncbi:hypothetical protein ACP4OV_016020 [Aristida adscensionis]